MNQTDASRPSAPVVLALSSNDEHGTVRVLDHPRRHAPEEEPGNGAQPLGPHHDQIGMLEAAPSTRLSVSPCTSLDKTTTA